MCYDCCPQSGVSSASRKPRSPDFPRSPSRQLSLGAQKRDRFAQTKRDLLTPKATSELAVRYDLPSLGDIFVGVGLKYAFIRQVTFIANAMVLSASIAVIAAGHNSRQSKLVLILGSVYASCLISLGVMMLVSSSLGCTGACYESVCTLKLYSFTNAVFIVSEVLLIYFLLFESGYGELFDEAWDNDEDSIRDEFDCDNKSDCKSEAKNKARRLERNLMTVGILVLVYQSVMIAATLFYIRGLHHKQYNIRQIAGVKSPHSAASSIATPMPGFGRGFFGGRSRQSTRGPERFKPVSTTLDANAVRRIQRNDTEDYAMY